MWNQILDKIEQLKRLDLQKQVFGSYQHKYAFNKVINENEVQIIENKLKTKLPSQLRSLFLEVGNGGVGPNYGILSAEKIYGYKPSKIYTDSLSLKKMMLEKYPEDYKDVSIDDEYFEISHEDITGLIVIIQEGCGHETCMVTTGKRKGDIVYISGDGLVYETSKSLLDIYEEWIDRELKIYNHVNEMIKSRKDYDEISESLNTEFQNYSAGDIIVSILNIEKPRSLFGTYGSEIHHGAVQFPWYREQLKKSYDQTEAPKVLKEKDQMAYTEKKVKKWFHFWKK